MNRSVTLFAAVMSGLSCMTQAQDACAPLFATEPTTSEFLPFVSDFVGMTSADLGGSIHPDLLVVHRGLVSILEGRGSGVFEPAAFLPLALNIQSGPTPIALGDFNSDGQLDFVLSNGGDTAVYYRKSDWNFFNPVFLAGNPSGEALTIIVEDFDSDGFPDFWLISSRTIQIVFGKEGISPGSSLLLVDYPGATGAYGDVNGDGLIDLVRLDGSIVSIYFRQQSGAPFTESIRTDLQGASGVRALISISAADRPGLVTFSSDAMRIFRIAPDGAMELHQEVHHEQAALPFSSVGNPLVGDFDGNGTEDIAVHRSSDVIVWRQSPQGVFSAPSVFGSDIFFNEVRPIPTISDFTGDGIGDFAGIRDFFTRSMQVEIHAGTINFCTADMDNNCILDLFDINLFVQSFTNGIPASDLDNNGLLDLSDISIFVESFTTCPT